jgi:hypothetical protein
MTVSAPTKKPEYIACTAPSGTKQRLEEFRKLNGLRSWSAAAVALIERGLREEGLA